MIVEISLEDLETDVKIIRNYKLKPIEVLRVEKTPLSCLIFKLCQLELQTCFQRAQFPEYKIQLVGLLCRSFKNKNEQQLNELKEEIFKKWKNELSNLYSIYQENKLEFLSW